MIIIFNTTTCSIFTCVVAVANMMYIFILFFLVVLYLALLETVMEAFVLERGGEEGKFGLFIKLVLVIV